MYSQFARFKIFLICVSVRELVEVKLNETAESGNTVKTHSNLKKWKKKKMRTRQK